MERRLQKDSRGSYVIFCAAKNTQSYKEKMLQNNNIEGMLPMQAQDVDHQHQLWYETTDKQTLAECFRQRAPGVLDIRALLGAIDQISKRLEHYLLEPEELMLTLNDIYIRNEQYYFIYLPEERKNIAEQMTCLMEQLMEHMDYENRMSVSLVYLLHARSRQQNCSIRSLRELCDEILREEAREAELRQLLPEERTAREEKEEYEQNKGEQKGRLIKQQMQERDSEKQEDNTDIKRKTEQPLSKTGKMTAIRECIPIKQITSFFERAASIFHAGYHAEETEETAEGGIYYAGGDTYTGEEAAKAEDNPGRAEEEKLYETDTVLLSDCEDTRLLLQNNSKAAICLEPLEDGKELIQCNGFPFYLGKEQQQPGYRFTESVISRRHAKIRKEAEEYYLVDEGSLNGTFLNGERLKSNECRKIVFGDIIGLADLFFIFSGIDKR